MANKNTAALTAAREKAIAAKAAKAAAKAAAETPAAPDAQPETVEPDGPVSDEEAAAMAKATADAEATPAAKVLIGTDGLPVLPRVKRTRKPKAPKACECGCGGDTRGGRFIPGHDAKLAGWALRVERGHIALSDIPHDGIRSAVAGVMATAKASKPMPHAPVRPSRDNAEGIDDETGEAI